MGALGSPVCWGSRWICGPEVDGAPQDSQEGHPGVDEMEHSPVSCAASFLHREELAVKEQMDPWKRSHRWSGAAGGWEGF